MKVFLAAIALIVFGSIIYAQQAPPPRGGPEGREDGPPPRAGRPGLAGRGPIGGPGAREAGPDAGGPEEMEIGGPAGRSAASSDPRMMKYEMLRGYLDAVDRYARLTRDPANSGIAAVVAAADILRPRGADASIEYFTKLLPEVKTPAVQRAIRIQLVDLYKVAGKQDLALEQLKQLITADTSGEPTPALPPPAGARGPRQ